MRLLLWPGSVPSLGPELGMSKKLMSGNGFLRLDPDAEPTFLESCFCELFDRKVFRGSRPRAVAADLFGGMGGESTSETGEDCGGAEKESRSA